MWAAVPTLRFPETGRIATGRLLPAHTPHNVLSFGTQHATQGTAPLLPRYSGGTFLYNIEANVSRVDDDVGRVFDITDVGAVMDELYIFYVDRCIFLVEVSSPGDSVLEGRVVPDVHLPLGVVEKLQLEKEDT